jgi:hypothetical protein
VKRQNPGWDLLMNVNWETELQAAAQKAGAAPTAASLAPAANETKSAPTNEAQTVTITSAPASNPPPASTAPSSNPVPLLWLSAGVCSLVGLFLLVRRS